MSTAKVYRIEDPETRRGPFSMGVGYEMPSKLYDRMYSMPVPEREWFSGASDQFFGCDSLDALEKAFCLRVRYFLRKFGYVISTYEVPVEYVTSCPKKVQLVFVKDKAKLVDERPLLAA